MSKSSTRHRSPTWWKDVVIYQIYPRSFADSDGDGIGDLNGIIGRLDHLAELGVDVVWLSPHFDSPNADNGYDVRDYRKVMTEFGTMEDFDRMLAATNERGIELVLDLVVNHTGDEHSWFRESRSSRDNPYRNYYIWRDGTPDGGPPNNYTSFFVGSAWAHESTVARPVRELKGFTKVRRDPGETTRAGVTLDQRLHTRHRPVRPPALRFSTARARRRPACIPEQAKADAFRSSERRPGDRSTRAWPSVAKTERADDAR